MTEECWICRRTKKEILEQAKKDDMDDCINERVVFIKMGNMFNREDYIKNICPTCEYIIRNLTESEFKSIIRDDLLIRLEDWANDKI